MMNLSFQKALFLLDQGDYERGEELLQKAIQTVTDPYEVAGIKVCYAQLLYEEERYEEAMIYVEEVLNIEEKYLFSEEKDHALELRKKMLGEHSCNLETGEPKGKRTFGRKEWTTKGKKNSRGVRSGIKDKWMQGIHRLEYELGRKEKNDMQYWRMRTEKVKNVHYRGIDEKNEEKLCPYLFDGESYADSWDSSLTIRIDEKKQNIAYSDVPMLATSFFIVNEKMLKLLYQYAKGAFELLDINCVDGDYVLVNVLDTMDCIDMEQSVYKVWKGKQDEIRSYEKLYLKKERLYGKNLFRAKHTSESFFLCSDQLKKEIEAQGIIGLSFEFID